MYQLSSFVNLKEIVNTHMFSFELNATAQFVILNTGRKTIPVIQEVYFVNKDTLLQNCSYSKLYIALSKGLGLT